jgi:hypothetical protein
MTTPASPDAPVRLSPARQHAKPAPATATARLWGHNAPGTPSTAPLPLSRRPHTLRQTLLLRLNMPEPLELIARARLAAVHAHEGTALECGAAPAKTGHTLKPAPGHAGGDSGGGDAAAAKGVLAKMRERVPIVTLFRHHLLEVALFIGVACYAQASVCECAAASPAWVYVKAGPPRAWLRAAEGMPATGGRTPGLPGRRQTCRRPLPE